MRFGWIVNHLVLLQLREELNMSPSHEANGALELSLISCNQRCFTWNVLLRGFLEILNFA